MSDEVEREELKRQVELTREDLQKLVEDRVQREAAELPQEEDTPETRAPGRMVRACSRSYDLGDGVLYAALNRGRYVYNSTAGRWMTWAEHFWEYDLMDDHLAAVENVVERYLQEAQAVEKEIREAFEARDDDHQKALEEIRKGIFTRVKRLRTENGRKACVHFARTAPDPLSIRGDELDLEPWLLACSNGVIDLDTIKFRKGRPEEFLSKASPVEWKGYQEPATAWESWLLEIFDWDQDLVDYMRRLCGYSLLGTTLEHIFVVLHGQGRNGKGTFVEVLNHILGPLAGSIRSELLLSSTRNTSAEAASPALMSLRGLRLAFASETDEGQHFSPARVKWCTGGDQLIGRGLYDRAEIRFKPTHTLFLLTNHKPHAPADDFAFWERVHLVPFNLSFVDREPVAHNERRARKGVAQELIGEASGILAWLVRGCKEYQAHGLRPPESVQEATRQYRRDEDLLADFLESHCKLGEHLQESAKDLFDRFSSWYEETISKKGISQKKAGTIFGRRFEKVKAKGRWHYKGVELIPDGGR